MAKFKLTLKNGLSMAIAFVLSLLAPNTFSQDVDVSEEEASTPKTAGEAAKESASGSLSAGAIAAAVAAAAAHRGPGPRAGRLSQPLLSACVWTWTC